MAHIALVGCGNMGFAMLRGWLAAGSHSFTVVEHNQKLRIRAEQAGCEVHDGSESIPGDVVFDAIVMATKPQTVCDLLPVYARHSAQKTVFISIAAGVSLSTMGARMDRPMALIRCMPNMPAAIGEGMTVCCANEFANFDQVNLTHELMSAIGKVCFIAKESKMDAVTAISGSGPAYVFHFIEALAAAGEKSGLDPDLAKLLATQTIYGASRLALEASQPACALREQVTSPNGTTAAALDVLIGEEKRFANLIHQAVEAASRRSTELDRS